MTTTATLTPTVLCGDAIELVGSVASGRRAAGLPPIKCIFADPPDNIGLEYDNHEDNMSEAAYLDWIGAFVELSSDACETLWLSFNSRWLLGFAHQLRHRLPNGWITPMVQTFTFGQHNHHDFGNNHRPLWRIRDPKIKTLADNIRVPSWRQLNGDKRADPRGRVPGDVFDFPRVTGNSKQRRSWHKTQLNEGLVERCVLSCTQPGDLVVDPFAGTGTTGRVCRRIGRHCVLIDKSPLYCQKMREEFAA